MASPEFEITNSYTVATSTTGARDALSREFLSSYEIKDSGGHVTERAHQDKNGWVIEHADGNGKFHKVTGLVITNVVRDENGNICRYDDKGINHEIDTKTNFRRRLDGTKLLAQWNDRFDRRIEYNFNGGDKAQSYDLRDAHNKLIKHVDLTTPKPEPQPRPDEPPLPVPPRPPEPGPEPRPQPPKPDVLPPVDIDEDDRIPPLPDRIAETRNKVTFEVSGNARDNGARLVQTLRSLPPDTTLILPPGQYDIPPGTSRIQLQGRDGQPIRIVGAGADKTVIAGGNDNSVLQFDHSSNFTIENMRFDGRGTRHDLRLTDCSNVKVRGSYFGPTTPHGDDDNSCIQVGGRSSNIEFTGNKLWAQGGHQSKTHAIYIGSGTATDIVIRQNDMHYAGAECGAMVQFNSDGKGRHRGAVVEGNSFISEPGASRDYGGGGIALAGVDDITIRNNKMSIARGAFIEVWGGGVGSGVIEGNTFQLTGAPRSRDEFVFDGNVRVGDVIMRNNNGHYNGRLRDMRRSRH